MPPTPVITLAPYMALPPDDAARVLDWPVMHKQLQQRAEAGFTVQGVTITGAAIVGADEKRRVLMAQARINYETPENDKPASYHVTFMPPAATLQMVFRVAGTATTKPGGTAAAEKHYVMLVEQSRVGNNARHNLETPGGILNDGERADQAAKREFVEEALPGHLKLDFLLSRLNSCHLHELGSTYLHPGMTDRQDQYAAIVDMDQNEFRRVQKINGGAAGNAAEGERTSVKLMPIDRAIMRQISTGESPHTLIALLRVNGLLQRQHLPRTQLPLPPAKKTSRVMRYP